MVSSYQETSPEIVADAAALGACRSRGSGAPAVERMARTEAPGDGECACLVNEAWEGRVWPALRDKLVGDGGGAEEIGDSLGAERRSCLGKNDEEGEAFKGAWSMRGITQALWRIDREKLATETVAR